MITESTIKQHPERAVPEQAPQILEKSVVAHVGFCIDGRPFVIPFAYHYDPRQPERLYLHGSLESRALKHLAAGFPVCVEVTEIHGLVYSRSAKFHSMNYQSVVCFGSGRIISDPAEKNRVFTDMVRRYFPEREAGRDYTEASLAHLQSTVMVEVEIREWSAKAREGGPRGPHDADPNALGTAGVQQL